MLSKIVTVSVGTPQTIVFSGDATAANPGANLPGTSVTIIISGGGTATVKTITAKGGTPVAVASGNLSGTISATTSDSFAGCIYGIQVTAATASCVVEVAIPQRVF